MVTGRQRQRRQGASAGAPLSPAVPLLGTSEDQATDTPTLYNGVSVASVLVGSASSEKNIHLSPDALQAMQAGYTPPVDSITPLVDWLRVTLVVEDDAPEVAVQKLQTMFGGAFPWEASGRGRWGYQQAMVRGYLTLMWGGNRTVCIDAPAHACRQLELEGLIPEDSAGGYDWSSFLGDLLDIGCRFRRVDWAIDDTSGLLTVGRVLEAQQAGGMVSRLRGAKSYHDYTSGGAGWSVGSRMGERYLRIYDKRAERLQAAVDPAALPPVWVRAEVETKDELAEALVRRFLTEGWSGIKSDMGAAVDFRDPDPNDSTVTRWQRCSWWADFLGSAEGVRTRIERATSTLWTAAAHIAKTAAPTIAACLEVLGPQWFVGMVRDGQRRWKGKHIDGMAAALRDIVPGWRAGLSASEIPSCTCCGVALRSEERSNRPGVCWRCDVAEVVPSTRQREIEQDKEREVGRLLLARQFGALRRMGLVA